MTGALAVLLQQAKSFQAAACKLANQVNRIFQLTFIRGLDALKPGWAAVAIHKDAIQDQELFYSYSIVVGGFLLMS